MQDCIFCKIIKGEIPSKKVYEDELMLVFHDIDPKAPVHLLAVPKKHIPKISEVKEEDKEILGHIMVKIPEILKKTDLINKGVRIVNNCEREAGQTVFHIHFHILGGRTFTWPPG